MLGGLRFRLWACKGPGVQGIGDPKTPLSKKSFPTAFVPTLHIYLIYLHDLQETIQHRKTQPCTCCAASSPASHRSRPGSRSLLAPAKPSPSLGPAGPALPSFRSSGPDTLAGTTAAVVPGDRGCRRNSPEPSAATLGWQEGSSVLGPARASIAAAKARERRKHMLR